MSNVNGSAGSLGGREFDRQAEREQMVSRQLEPRDIVNQRVLEAMRQVPRHLFMPAEQQAYAYDDRPLSIGHGQTISQPYIVALMSQLSHAKPGHKVLEIGTGSGYQAAVLAHMGATVYSLEVVAPLARRASELFERLGYPVQVQLADGFHGWPEQGPFDAVVITAAPPETPEPLKQQLRIGGRVVVPVGQWQQDLTVIERHADGFEQYDVIPVMFVPMTGEAQKRAHG